MYRGPKTLTEQRQDAIRHAAKHGVGIQGAEPAWRIECMVADLPIMVRGTTEAARIDLERCGRMTIIEFGAWCNRHWSPGFLVDGCAATNMQLFCTRHACDHAVMDGIRMGECCGDMPRGHDGLCPRVLELCPLVRAAGRIIREESDE